MSSLGGAFDSTQWSIVLAAKSSGPASGGGDGVIQQTAEGLGSWESGNAAVTALAFSPDGVALISGGEDGSVRAWDIASMRNWLGVLGLGF